MSASTIHSSPCAASLGRLNLAAGSGKVGSWCAKRNDVNQWLQIDLGSLTTVTKVATQGRQDSSQWVTTYSLSYSLTGSYWVQYTVRGKKKVTYFLLSDSELLHVAFWNNRCSITDFPGLIPHVKVALGNILISVFLWERHFWYSGIFEPASFKM